MVDTDGDTTMAHEIGNIRFLIEQQIKVVDELDRSGRDGRSAQDLLRRLLRRDEELRKRMAPPQLLRVA